MGIGRKLRVFDGLALVRYAVDTWIHGSGPEEHLGKNLQCRRSVFWHGARKLLSGDAFEYDDSVSFTHRGPCEEVFPVARVLDATASGSSSGNGNQDAGQSSHTREGAFEDEQ